MARLRTTALVAVLLLVAGCSGESDDGLDIDSGPPGERPGSAALVESFEAAAEEAYEAGDADRSEHFSRGVLIEEGCFMLDDAGAVAVAEALEVDADVAAEIDDGSGFLQGMPGQRETLACNIAVGEDQRIVVKAGTTVFERDEMLEQLELDAEQDDKEVELLEGEAPGLDEAAVLAVDQGSHVTFSWIGDDFLVTLTVYDGMVDTPPSGRSLYDRCFEALPVLVENVGRTLTGG